MNYWLTGWLAKWLTEWATNLTCDWLTGWLANDWLTERLTNWLADRLTGERAKWLYDWATDLMTDRSIDSETDHLTNDWPADRQNYMADAYRLTHSLALSPSSLLTYQSCCLFERSKILFYFYLPFAIQHVTVGFNRYPAMQLRI